ncbi:proton-coupled folate transporter-like isoform X2 [Liolophura sinensis]
MDSPLESEVKPLVKDRNAVVTDDGQVVFKQGGVFRKGVLEVVVITFYTALMSFFPIVQQYIYNRVLTEEMNRNPVNASVVTHTDDTTETCGRNGSSAAEAVAQKQAAQWLLYFGLATNIPGIFSTMILGAYTDFRGRKIGMIVPAIGSLIRTVISMFVIGLDWPMALFVVGGLIDGTCGSFGTVFMAAFAYLADTTQPGKERTMRIAILQAAIGICMSVALMGTGFLIKAAGFFYPMFLSLGSLLINVPLVLFLLPETIQKRNDIRILDWKRISNAFITYVKPREDGKRWKLLSLLLALFMVDMVQIGKAQIDTLFQLGVPFCWDSVKIGIYSAIAMFLQIFGLLAFLRPLQKFFSDNTIGIIGSVSGTAFLIMTGLSVNDAMLYAAPFIGLLYGVPSAMLKAVMSLYVGKQEQGCLFAGICSIQMLCSTVGSVVFNAVYMATVTTFAGFVFILMAILFVICIVCMTVVEIFGRAGKRYESITPVAGQ